MPDEKSKEQPKGQPTDVKPPQENPPAEGDETQPETAKEPKPEQADYKPIAPEDDKENPVYVEVPKTDEEVAEEGTKLSQAESSQTGGVVPFLSTEKAENKRIWAMDAAHNTNDRQGGRGAEHPDLVETAQ